MIKNYEGKKDEVKNLQRECVVLKKDLEKIHLENENLVDKNSKSMLEIQYLERNQKDILQKSKEKHRDLELQIKRLIEEGKNDNRDLFSELGKLDQKIQRQGGHERDSMNIT